MQKLPIALIFAACAVLASCQSNDAKPEVAAAPTASSTATTPQATPAPAAEASKPVCPPEATTTAKKKKKTKKKAKAAPPPADCVPAQAQASPQAAESKPAAAAAPTTPAKTGCNPCTVKSRDGSFEGEVYGNIPPHSKWAKLQIGMEQPEVERILGGTSNDVRTMPTGKAFIPFYYGTDRYRYEVVYHGQGSVSYTGGSWGGGRGVLMMINYDPKMQ